MTVFQVMMIMIYKDNDDDLGRGFKDFVIFIPAWGR